MRLHVFDRAGGIDRPNSLRLLFGYGQVLSNGCGSRALVLLGRGNLRSLVVVIVLAAATLINSDSDARKNTSLFQYLSL